MSNRNFLLKGTLLLTLSGFLTKIIGFIYIPFSKNWCTGYGNLSAYFSRLHPMLCACSRRHTDSYFPSRSGKSRFKRRAGSARCFSPVNFSGCCHFYSDRIFSVPSRELVCRTFFIRRAMYPSFKNIGIFPSFWCVSRLCQRLLSRQKKTFCSCFRPAH